jgi:hypothetical protein
MSVYSDAVNSLVPAAYWRLGELSGTVAADETTINDGTYIGSPTLGAASLVPSDIGDSAVLFNGTDSSVNIPAATLSSPTEYSVIAIVKTDSETSQSVHEYNGDGIFTILRINNGGVSGDILFRTTSGGVSQNIIVNIGSVVGITKVLVLTAKENDFLRAYIDGVEVGTAVATTTFNDSPAATIGRAIGTSRLFNADFFSGVIDDVALYPVALSAANVTTLYNAYLLKSYADAILAHTPVYLYKLDETSGTVAVDATGNVNGTYENGVTLGSTALVPSVTDTSSLFDGVDDVVSAPVALHGLGDITIGASVRSSISANQNQFLSLSATGELESSNFRYLLGYISGSFRYFHEYGIGINESLPFTKFTPLDNVTYNLVVTREVATKTVSLYVNGALIESLFYINDPTGGTSTQVYIGSNDSNTASSFGNIAYAFAIDSLLTFAEIGILYNSFLASETVLKKVCGTFKNTSGDAKAGTARLLDYATGAIIRQQIAPLGFFEFLALEDKQYTLFFQPDSSILATYANSDLVLASDNTFAQPSWIGDLEFVNGRYVYHESTPGYGGFSIKTAQHFAFADSTSGSNTVTDQFSGYLFPSQIVTGVEEVGMRAGGATAASSAFAEIYLTLSINLKALAIGNDDFSQLVLNATTSAAAAEQIKNNRIEFRLGPIGDSSTPFMSFSDQLNPLTTIGSGIAGWPGETSWNLGTFRAEFTVERISDSQVRIIAFYTTAADRVTKQGLSDIVHTLPIQVPHFYSFRAGIYNRTVALRVRVDEMEILSGGDELVHLPAYDLVAVPNTEFFFPDNLGAAATPDVTLNTATPDVVFMEGNDTYATSLSMALPAVAVQNNRYKARFKLTQTLNSITNFIYIGFAINLNSPMANLAFAYRPNSVSESDISTGEQALWMSFLLNTVGDAVRYGDGTGDDESFGSTSSRCLIAGENLNTFTNGDAFIEAEVYINEDGHFSVELTKGTTTINWSLRDIQADIKTCNFWIAPSGDTFKDTRIEGFAQSTP